MPRTWLRPNTWLRRRAWRGASRIRQPPSRQPPPGGVAANVHPRRSSGRTHPARHATDPMKSTFCNPVEIFLEMRRAPFHYSVIGWDTRMHLAPGLADCHLLNDDVSASSSRGGTAGARASAGGERRLSQVEPECNFEPIQERFMQMIAVLLSMRTSISRSRISE
jgi:hypothetical protein